MDSAPAAPRRAPRPARGWPSAARTRSPARPGPTVTVPAATASPAMTMENSPRATSAAPARSRPSRADPVPPGRPPAGDHLGRRSSRRPARRRPAAPAGSPPGRCCSPKSTKNTAANRSRSGSSSLVAFSAVAPGDRDAEQERADRRGDLQRRGECRPPAAPRPSSRSRNTSGSGLSTIVGDLPAVAQRHDQHHRDRDQRDADRLEPADEPDAGQHGGEDRQVHAPSSGPRRRGPTAPPASPGCPAGRDRPAPWRRCPRTRCR